VNFDSPTLAEPVDSGTADVVKLAAAILGDYFPGSELFQSLQDLGEASSLIIRFNIDSSTLREGIAVLSAVQLVMSAAFVATEYASGPYSDGSDINIDFLTELASNLPFDLELVELTLSSIKGAVQFVQKRATSGNLLAAAAIFAIVAPHISIPVAIGAVIINKKIGDKEKKETDQKIKNLKDEFDHYRQDHPDLEEHVKETKLTSIDREALRDVHVESVDVEIGKEE
jgi:hypothetical protein